MDGETHPLLASAAERASSVEGVERLGAFQSAATMAIFDMVAAEAPLTDA